VSAGWFFYFTELDEDLVLKNSITKVADTVYPSFYLEKIFVNKNNFILCDFFVGQRWL
jgi:hypothetical protein